MTRLCTGTKSISQTRGRTRRTGRGSAKPSTADWSRQRACPTTASYTAAPQHQTVVGAQRCSWWWRSVSRCAGRHEGVCGHPLVVWSATELQPDPTLAHLPVRSAERPRRVVPGGGRAGARVYALTTAASIREPLVHAWTDPIRLVAPRWTDSPLGLGTLTGKFSSDKLPSGPRKAIAEKLLDDPAFGQLITTMRTVGEAHDGATPAQVALGWCTAKGACVIPGARTLSQA
jgi:hypothetical protein